MLVIGVLAACGLTVSLMQTLVVPLLPRFPVLLDTTPATVTWLVTATLIAGAVCTPLLGRLGDMYGKRRLLLVALGLVALGSAVGTAAPDVGTLIAGRVLQGAAMGAIPLGISIMRDVLPPGRVGAGIGLMSSSLGIGGALALPLGGLVAQEASWRWLFAATGVLALGLLGAVAGLVPESALRTGGRFDLLGAAGLAAALTCLLLAISKGSEWGWTAPAVLGLLAAAAVLSAAWGAWEWRTPRPLVDLRISARPAVLWTNVASALVGFAMFAGFLLATQQLQAPPATGYGFGLSLVATGLVLLPTGVAMMVFSPLSARISRARGPRTTVVLGTAVLGVGNAALACMLPSAGLVAFAMVLTAVGTALAYAAVPLMIMNVVPATETASANGLNALMRSLGTSSCSAFVAAVTSALVTRTEGLVLPSATAIVVVYSAGAAAALAAALIVWCTDAGRRRSDPADVRDPQRVEGRPSRSS
ncbi:Major Facilitator Superfamily protein [Pseudonocardia thermophila]|jgi:Arabinose efflux permease|uniref:Major Facilitator Superfamily protein n=1 Tax=Pseudonocardia thermophila TaxID=1848 RepID=A0A1M7B455_PSETH|nr:MFS transporter [Pseudonocardia thermophila]SHL49798.1 Major Facilitator Superfamily protein [Pseudonocardia thermophila]